MVNVLRFKGGNDLSSLVDGFAGLPLEFAEEEEGIPGGDRERELVGAAVCGSPVEGCPASGCDGCRGCE
jgi:hypothetical protein